MHEVSVVTSLVDAVIAELGKYKVEKVNSVTAVIGDLTNLGEEQMAFAYEIPELPKFSNKVCDH